MHWKIHKSLLTTDSDVLDNRNETISEVFSSKSHSYCSEAEHEGLCEMRFDIPVSYKHNVIQFATTSVCSLHCKLKLKVITGTP